MKSFCTLKHTTRGLMAVATALWLLAGCVAIPPVDDVGIDPDVERATQLFEEARYDAATQVNHVTWRYEVDGVTDAWVDELPMRIFFPRELDALITRIRDEKGVSILLIEHDMKLVMSISQSIFVMDYGRLIAQGSPREVAENPNVIKAYLGETFDA